MELELTKERPSEVPEDSPRADFYLSLWNHSAELVEVSEVGGGFCGSFSTKIGDEELCLKGRVFHDALFTMAIPPRKRTIPAHSRIIYPVNLADLVSDGEFSSRSSWTNPLSNYFGKTFQVTAKGDWLDGKPESGPLIVAWPGKR